MKARQHVAPAVFGEAEHTERTRQVAVATYLRSVAHSSELSITSEHVDSTRTAAYMPSRLLEEFKWS